MKSKFLLTPICLILAGSSQAQNLYDVGIEPEQFFPLNWSVGTSFIYDDNIMPGTAEEGQSSMALNPNLGANFGNESAQTTWNVVASLGFIYYFDQPEAAGDQLTSQSRVTGTFNHRYSERLRFTNSSFVAYELEPNYAFGQATARNLGAFLSWQTDNSVGFRWGERIGTNTGMRLSATDFADSTDNDRNAIEFYNQFRYQFDPQTVLTTEYRISDITANGVARDSRDQFLTAGFERSFNERMSAVGSAGLQYRDVETGDSGWGPFMQIAFNGRLTEDFSVRAFTRYSTEGYDTVLRHPEPGIGTVEFDARETLRVGITADYVISPILSLFGGLDYIPTTFAAGRSVDGSFDGDIPDVDDELINAFIGLRVNFTDAITGTVSYNITESASDAIERDYSRNRFSIGVQAAF